jgi:hypothetical protein
MRQRLVLKMGRHSSRAALAMAEEVSNSVGEPISQRAYARRRGVTHRAIQKAIASGRIVVDELGRIDPELADLHWDANSRPTTGQDVCDGTAPKNYAHARAVREHFRAELARLEYEKRAGKLVDADGVKAAAFNEARHARDQLLALPDRLAPVLAGLDDAGEIHRVLTAEIRLALVELSRHTPPVPAQPSD